MRIAYSENEQTDQLKTLASQESCGYIRFEMHIDSLKMLVILKYSSHLTKMKLKIVRK